MLCKLTVVCWLYSQILKEKTPCPSALFPLPLPFRCVSRTKFGPQDNTTSCRKNPITQHTAVPIPIYVAAGPYAREYALSERASASDSLKYIILLIARVFVRYCVAYGKAEWQWHSSPFQPRPSALENSISMCQWVSRFYGCRSWACNVCTSELYLLAILIH